MEASICPAVQPRPSPSQFPVSYQRGTHRISLPYLNRTISIAVEDILYLQGECNYTFLHTRDRKRYLVSKTLKVFERTLSPDLFLRIHKSYLVNLAYVHLSPMTSARYVCLLDGREIAISRRRVRGTILQLARYRQCVLDQKVQGVKGVYTDKAGSSSSGIVSSTVNTPAAHYRRCWPSDSDSSEKAALATRWDSDHIQD